MMDKKEYKIVRKANLIERIHLVIVCLHIGSSLLMIFSSTLRFYAAIYVGLIGITYIFLKGSCPVTLKENKMRKILGQEEKKGFIHYYFEKNFNIELPNKLIYFFILITFALAYFIILNHFFKWI